jgi:hypothetical protein
MIHVIPVAIHHCGFLVIKGGCAGKYLISSECVLEEGG